MSDLLDEISDYKHPPFEKAGSRLVMNSETVEQLLNRHAGACTVRMPKREIWAWRLVSAALGIALAGACVAIAASHADAYSYGKTLPDKGHVWTVILRHVDGDTVQLGSIVDEGTVRLLDADAPEMEPRLNLTDAEKRDPVKLAARKAEIEAEKKLARASAKRLAELLPVNSVWRTEVAGHDGFDRPLVRFVRDDGKTINQQMIDEGHAKEYVR